MRNQLLCLSLLLVLFGCDNKPKQNPPANPPIAQPTAVQPEGVQPAPERKPEVANDVVQKVSAIISEILQTDRSKIKPETPLDKLGADDLDIVEIVMELEDKFDINISENDADQLFGINKPAPGQQSSTIQQLAEFVIKEQKSPSDKSKPLPSSKERKKLTNNAKEAIDKKSVYRDMRDRALKTKREEIGLANPPDDKPVWGILMETGLDSASYTLVAFSDGSNSLYFSGGGGIIGGGGQEPARLAALEFIALANKHRDTLKETKETPLPSAGDTVFYLIQDGKILTTTANENELGNNRHVLSPLFHSGHKLIGELRKFSEKNK